MRGLNGGFCSDRNNSQIESNYTKDYKKITELVSHLLYENKDILDKANSYKFTNWLCERFPSQDTLELTLKAEQLKTKKLFDSILKPSVTLSKQEYQCLEILAQGRSMKEIAKFLNLSPRTVQSYIWNVKCKAACNFKSDLLNMFFNNRFSTVI